MNQMMMVHSLDQMMVVEILEALPLVGVAQRILVPQMGYQIQSGPVSAPGEQSPLEFRKPSDRSVFYRENPADPDSDRRRNHALKVLVWVLQKAHPHWEI